MSKLRRRLTYLLLGVFAALQPIIFLLLITAPSYLSLMPSEAYESETWRYSRFWEAINSQEIEQVTLNEDLTVAIAETIEGTTIRVNLPNDPELKTELTQNDIDFEVDQASFSNFNLGRSLLSLALLGVPIVIFLTGSTFWFWMLIDCATQEGIVDSARVAWIIIIIFTAWAGALAYFLIERPQRQNQLPG